MIKNHPLCPKKHPLVVRNSKYGKFFGCLTYPNHKIVVERPDCPKGHIMMLRKGPYGEFFGCINYPNCKETYDFEVKDKRYHAKLWEEFNKSKYFKEETDEYELEHNIASKVSKRDHNQFGNYQNKYQREASEYKNKIKPKKNSRNYKEDLKKYNEKGNFTIEGVKDKNSPKLDMRLPKGLSKEEEKEYIRLYESEYSNHILVKKPGHLLKQYLQDSIEHRRILGSNNAL